MRHVAVVAALLLLLLFPPLTSALVGNTTVMDYIQVHSLFPPMLQNFWENGMLFWSFGLHTVVTDNYVRLTTSAADARGYLWNRHVNLLEAFELNATVQMRRREEAWMRSAKKETAGMGIWYTSASNFTNHSDTSLFGFQKRFRGVGVVLTHSDELFLLSNNNTRSIDPTRMRRHGFGRCPVPSLGELHLTITLRFDGSVFSVFYVYHEGSEPRLEDFARSMPCTSLPLTPDEGKYRFGVSAINVDTSQAIHEVHSVVMTPMIHAERHEGEERDAQRVHLFAEDDKVAREKLLGSAEDEDVEEGKRQKDA